ncbi:hypothetical protein I3842_01G061900 [Carya illinoinensis]|uniref:RING-type domain-containing protein n=1 Tax=Carya illinoinensis TaxID=32201 RepID=A0A922K5Z7_CARIL|nr:hypothetical protein I3842_01G061900 [Carya illinoinensis]
MTMGFPAGYSVVFFHALSVLGFIRSFIFLLSHFLGLSDFLKTDAIRPVDEARMPEHKPKLVFALLIQEFLPVMKFQDLAESARPGDLPESCAVCLYEFEDGEEIRWLRNCRHIFHRTCLDQWMDHDRKTCPLCRTQFVPEEMKDEFNRRLWTASGHGPDLYSE